METKQRELEKEEEEGGEKGKTWRRSRGSEAACAGSLGKEAGAETEYLLVS